jgi:ubiquinone/menaquinone biosynthesis C-methylase UbiE
VGEYPVPSPPQSYYCPGLGSRIHAWVLANLGHRYDRMVADRKRALFAGLGGSVLEIGPGTGPNLAYYPPGIRWVGVEPNPYMVPHLQAAAARAGLPVDLRSGTAERIPADDNSMDAVVSTLVLCSVADPEIVLREVHRVLKPGGRFLFLEHVAAPPGTFLRRVQTFILPFWKLIGDGCNPNRDTGPAIEHARFSEVTYENFRLPLGPVAPQIVGVAVK